METTMQVYDGRSKALKHVETLDTSNPEHCLRLTLAIFTAGGNISANMAAIPKADKERLFDYLNNEQAFPAERYTKRIEEIHEAIGFELAY